MNSEEIYYEGLENPNFALTSYRYNDVVDYLFEVELLLDDFVKKKKKKTSNLNMESVKDIHGVSNIFELIYNLFIELILTSPVSPWIYELKDIDFSYQFMNVDTMITNFSKIYDSMHNSSKKRIRLQKFCDFFDSRTRLIVLDNKNNFIKKTMSKKQKTIVQMVKTKFLSSKFERNLKKQIDVSFSNKAVYISTLVDDYWNLCNKIMIMEIAEKKEYFEEKLREKFQRQWLRRARALVNAFEISCKNMKKCEDETIKPIVRKNIHKKSKVRRLHYYKLLKSKTKSKSNLNESFSSDVEICSDDNCVKNEVPANIYFSNDNLSVNSEKTFLNDFSSILFNGKLRNYQTSGFNWLLKLHDCGMSGILGDEMGLGKTIQTIALLTYLASERGLWGPHLIIVPSSVLYNWKEEFEKFSPGFKVVVYDGTKSIRKLKRKGLYKKFAFNVLITSYNIAVVDDLYLKKIGWYYLILDEAHFLKNFTSIRWRKIFFFKAFIRLLLTGTPIQNNLIEIWSLMYFIYPEIFGNHNDFNRLFNNPVTAAIENQKGSIQVTQTIQILCNVLKPFFLRRMKENVQKELPRKTEYVIKCSLNYLQKKLYHNFVHAYDDDIKNVKKKNSMFNSLALIMNLKKICNHPELIESSLVESPIFGSEFKVNFEIPSISSMITKNILIYKNLYHKISDELIDDTHIKFSNDKIIASNTVNSKKYISSQIKNLTGDSEKSVVREHSSLNENNVISLNSYLNDKYTEELNKLDWNNDDNNYYLRTYLFDVLNKRFEIMNVKFLLFYIKYNLNGIKNNFPEVLVHRTPCGTLSTLSYDSKAKFDYLENFCVKYLNLLFNRLKVIPHFKFYPPGYHVSFNAPSTCFSLNSYKIMNEKLLNATDKHFYSSRNLDNQFSTSHIIMSNPKDMEFTSGKLLPLKKILQNAHKNNEKVVIFTQMSGMLNILERFLCIYSMNYLRMDGNMKIEKRQDIINKFNNDPKIAVFISSIKTGGVGINLTSASVIIFYDSDWNPTTDKQAMDRCHRIGQNKNVSIYRLISEYTIEENIWRKQLEKRKLNTLILNKGKFDDNSENYDLQNTTGSLIFSINQTDDLYATRELFDNNDLTDINLIDESYIAWDENENQEDLQIDEKTSSNFKEGCITENNKKFFWTEKTERLLEKSKIIHSSVRWIHHNFHRITS